MQKKIAIFVLILSIRIFADASAVDKYVQFIAGTLILRSASISPEEKAIAYRDLQRVTGVSAPEGRKYVESFRGKPEQWKEIQTAVSAFLDSAEKKTMLKPDTTILHPQPALTRSGKHGMPDTAIPAKRSRPQKGTPADSNLSRRHDGRRTL